MKKSTIYFIAIVVLVIIFALWMSMRTPSVAPTLPTSGIAINVGTNPTLGNFLTGENGMTLYHFTNDKPGVSTCVDACATNWPAYTIASTAVLKAVPEVLGTLATITRADGKLQVTYNGNPLYFWHLDSKVGDTNGQGIGGVWFVEQP